MSKCYKETARRFIIERLAVSYLEILEFLEDSLLRVVRWRGRAIH